MVPQATRLGDVDAAAEGRWSTGCGEFDRVLGGGVVPGSAVLVGGEPGIGKSTLLLQAAHGLANDGVAVLYVSGEESPRHLRLRAERLGLRDTSVRVAAATDCASIMALIAEGGAQVVVVDSIQTMHLAELDSPAGSVAQVRECAGRLTALARECGAAVLLVGHVTKEGHLAGPKVTEHVVDVVLLFEGDRTQPLKVLRAVKNRFGSTNEVGLFEMQDRGLVEVVNPSALLLEERSVGASGTVATCTVEGTRPLVLEVQALVAPTPFAAPRRVASGIDISRLHLLLAVVEQRGGIRLENRDVYVNVVGGVRVGEPAADLAVAVAVAASRAEFVVAPDAVVFGEVGLAGEVRAVGHAARRLEEAARLGFSTAVVPARTAREVRPPDGLAVVGVATVAEAVAAVQERKTPRSAR